MICEYSKGILLGVTFSLVLLTSLAEGDQCIDNLKNTAVRQGQLNTILNLATDTKSVRWIFTSTSNESISYTISDYGGILNPSLSNLYDVNQTGLIIKYATTTEDANPISTAGLYIGQCANNTNSTAAKLLVVRSGPDCGYVPISSNTTKVSCSFAYADSTSCPIYPNVTWRRNGEYLASYTNEFMKRVRAYPFVFRETSNITIESSAIGNYTCELIFSEPTADAKCPFIATNAPEFTESCSVLVRNEAILSTEPPVATLTTSRPTIPARDEPTSSTDLTAPTLSPTTTPSTTGDSYSACRGSISTTTLNPTATTTPQATGRNLSASLTRRPVNTAAINGSSNITLGCASSYGTESIRWSFTPLASISNETIWIADGHQLNTTHSQQYGLQASVNSSTLVILQLSSVTEGTYRCYDCVDDASALLLMIRTSSASPPSPSMSPLSGPIAGGTNIVITGLTVIGQLLRNADPQIPAINGVRNVYFGDDLLARNVSLLPDGSSALDVVTITSNTTKESIGRPLPIIIEFSPIPFNMSFNTAFTYRPNPEITGTSPKSFIVTGGTLLDVFGHGFSSVANPIIQLTVNIYRSADNSTALIKLNSTTTTSRNCTIPPGNDTYMQCPMPPLNLTAEGDFLQNLNIQYNGSTIRRRRDTSPSVDIIVLTVYGANGIDHADIYLEFNLDGYKKNVNKTDFMFYSPPEIDQSDEVIEFDPSEDELIAVKGRYMMRGVRKGDYLVLIGNEMCVNFDLTDNELTCKPPKVEPSLHINRCGDHLSISITLGYLKYEYACLEYTDRAAAKRFALIVGLTVGLAGLAFFLTLLVICILSCRRRQLSQETERRPKPSRQTFRNPNFNNDVYSESQEDQSRRRQDYDDDISVNEDYLNYFDDFDRKSPYPPSSVPSDGNFHRSSDAIYTNSRQL